MIKDFKEFIKRGNVLGLAVAVIVGGAFGKVVSSFVNDIIMPPVGLFLSNTDFGDLYVNLSGKAFGTLAAAQAAGAPTINYGAFINTVIDFLIVAGVSFLIVRAVQRLETLGTKEAPPPETVECPHCLSTIPAGATRCAHCTSRIEVRLASRRV